MCGRYANDLPPDLVPRVFRARNNIAGVKPRYNAAPTQDLPVVRYNAEAGERQVDLLRWGLVPIWAKDAAIGTKMINARAETVASKPAFRDAFAKRRCIVPAAAFYEWKKTGQGKQPCAIAPKEEGRLLAFAGLWERWKNPETQEILRSFTIVTGKPNSLMAAIHDRMPVILHEDDWAKWLGETPAQPAELQRMIDEPYPSQLMRAFPVSTRVNSVRNDDASLLAPLEGDGGGPV